MKLETWALIAEIVSGLAIVATLIVLLLEIRGNTAAIRASTYQNVVDSITTTLHERAFDPDVSRLWYAGDDGKELEPLDERRFSALVTANMRRFENAFYQYRIGGMESTQWQGVEAALRSVITTPGHRRWWIDNKQLYSDEFQNLIDDILEN